METRVVGGLILEANLVFEGSQGALYRGTLLAVGRYSEAIKEEHFFILALTHISPSCIDAC